MNQPIAILGGGKIGALAAAWLSEQGEYPISIWDCQLDNPDLNAIRDHYPNLTLHQVDITDSNFPKRLQASGAQALLSCLPFFCNLTVAKAALKAQLHYFDLTEDVATSAAIQELSLHAETAFVPQCGLAPGMVGLLAHDLSKDFDELDYLHLRVGALPTVSHHRLLYALNWSIDGLVNEYLNPCRAIEQGNPVTLAPLEGLEPLTWQGKTFEAFNTSGGLGHLIECLSGKVRSLNYKTIRYPGHCERMSFLIHDLKLGKKKALLTEILREALPRTMEDWVMLHVAAGGHIQGEYLEKQITKGLYGQKIGPLTYTAIQSATIAGACAVMLHLLKHPQSGFVYQETLPLDAIQNNVFGAYYV